MTGGPRRLASGGRIDRRKRLSFRFDGRAFDGHAGDTLASALLANGVTLIGRSFKYHRPRGIHSAGIEEPNALVTVGTAGRRDPNLPATVIDLVDGLEAASQNRWPSLAFDLLAVNQLFGPLLSAGFYYKTFMGPTKRSWMFYERFIRRAAGLGRATEEADPDRYETEYAFTDVAVIGSGPAGLAAALAAMRCGARVTLVEQDSETGGALLSLPADGEASAWLATVRSELEAGSRVSIRTRTTAFGLYDGNTIGLVDRRDHLMSDPTRPRARQRFVLLQAKAIVFASGAIERPLLFANNDRPGVMLASAVTTYANRFAVACGRQAVIATDNDSAYAAAHALTAAGASVTVVDARPRGTTATAAEAAGIAVRPSSRLLGVTGRLRVSGAAVAPLGGGAAERLSCDLVASSGGWTPTVHLTAHLGITPRYRDDIGAFVPGGYARGHFAAGAVTGSFATEAAIREGLEAGRAAAEAAGFPAAPTELALLSLPHDGACAAPAPLPVPSRGKIFVDIQNDVTAADIRLADQEGYRSIEHVKRYTTLGMGTDQGKTSNVNGLLLMAAARKQSIPETGTTTFRPPFSPVAIGVLAGRAVGRHFKPIRRTPLHDWHLENGAEMLEVGLWKRPLFYRMNGADAGAASVAEMRLVRSGVGMVDVSTLGKIEVQGPDALEFLVRVYVNNLRTLKIGMGRYGVMLRDDGIVFDEGVVIRLAATRFFLTTSTAKAADVQCWLEFLAETAWPDLKVHIVSVTDEWAMVALAGPSSGKVLAAAFPDLDTSDGHLPKMGFVEGRYRGAVLRIQRMSYSGERAYEIHVGARRGRELAEHLTAVGVPFGLRPYGVDAMGALRVEKGFAAGSEIDGTTTLDDLGLGGLARKSGGFVGDALRHRPALVDPARRRLVGLECVEPGKRLRAGSILFAKGTPPSGHGIGHITAVTYSPELDRHIALALLSGGPDRLGGEVAAVHPVKMETVAAKVVAPVFIDPEGTRLDA